MMQDAMNVRMQADIKLIEDTMSALLPPRTDCAQRKLVDAIYYSLEAGGKRIRPMLAVEFCRICGGTDDMVLPAACALELYHTSTLIHDDLPEMDNDVLRRGKPSCHVAYGTATALLAGDTLMMLPFAWIANTETIDDTRKIALVRELAEAGGLYGACGGQQIDLQNENRTDVTAEELEEMYSYKTGALLVAGCRMGCIAAGADETTIAIAESYAKKTGLAFQIVDDILDVTADEKALGKPVGSDVEQNKNTFVSLYGIEQAKEKARLLTEEAVSLLSKLPDSEFLRALTEFLLTRQF